MSKADIQFAADVGISFLNAEINVAELVRNK